MKENMIFGRITPRPWMGIFGLLGFMGFVWIPFNEPTYVVFFGFFGFFAWYWEGKLAKEMADERLNENRNKATQISYQTVFAIVYASMILIGNLVGPKDPAKAYLVLNAVVALSFAFSLILAAYLTYRYDKNGGGDE